MFDVCIVVGCMVLLAFWFVFVVWFVLFLMFVCAVVIVLFVVCCLLRCFWLWFILGCLTDVVCCDVV